MFFQLEEVSVYVKILAVIGYSLVWNVVANPAIYCSSKLYPGGRESCRKKKPALFYTLQVFYMCVLAVSTWLIWDLMKATTTY